MITIDKPRERTKATLGVSLRTVYRVHMESQVRAATNKSKKSKKQESRNKTV